MTWRAGEQSGRAVQCKEKVQSARTEWMKNNPETVKNNTEMKFSD